MVLGGEPQVGGQVFPVGEQALNRGRVERLVAGGELIEPDVVDGHQFRSGGGGEVLGPKIFQQASLTSACIRPRPWPECSAVGAVVKIQLAVSWDVGSGVDAAAARRSLPVR